MPDRHQNTVVSFLNEAITRCAATHSGINKRELEWIMEAATGTSRIQWIVGSDSERKSDWQGTFNEMLARRMTGEPVQHILGEASFYGRSFRVNPDVLIPRPETEQLVEWAVSKARSRERPRVLDIGTGSGCIAITFALEIPTAEVFALDISEEALATARDNAEKLGASVQFDRIDVLRQSIPHGPFTFLISNPPYIPVTEKSDLQTEVLNHEPHIALFAGEDPLVFYRRIAAVARDILVEGGLVGVEIHEKYASEVVRVFVDAGLREVRIKKDLAGKDRIITACVD